MTQLENLCYVLRIWILSVRCGRWECNVQNGLTLLGIVFIVLVSTHGHILRKGFLLACTFSLWLMGALSWVLG